jgi:acetyltransferase EpsM
MRVQWSPVRQLGRSCKEGTVGSSRAADGVVIIGAGQHGRVVLGLVLATGLTVTAFYDDDPAKWGLQIGGACVIGPISELGLAPKSKAIIAIGDNRVRKRIAERCDLDWVTLVHPFTAVDPSAVLGVGTIVLPGTVVLAGATMGSHVIVNAGSIINHNARAESYSHVSDAHLGAGASLGEGALLAVGALVIPRITVGAWAIVGAGAVAIRDVPPGVTVIGVPAREMFRP